MTVPAGTIVKRFNVIEDIGPGQITRFIDTFFDALLLQAAEEADHRVRYRLELQAR